jgi:hypothetical protein
MLTFLIAAVLAGAPPPQPSISFWIDAGSGKTNVSRSQTDDWATDRR